MKAKDCNNTHGHGQHTCEECEHPELRVPLATSVDIGHKAGCAKIIYKNTPTPWGWPCTCK